MGGVNNQKGQRTCNLNYYQYNQRHYSFHSSTN